VQILNYNIHDIIKFRIIRGRGYDLRDLINLKFSFFEVEDVGDPDITLNIGKFTPSNENCYLVDYKYYIKENYFYCKDSEGKAEWEVEISGFEDGETIVNFNGRIKGFQSFMNPDFIAQNFLLRLIEYKLCRKGYLFAHAAGISKNEQAYVFAGRGGSFKTSLCMDFIRKAGFEFLGDDRVVLHKDKVFSFPMGLRVFGFMCDHLPNEDSWNFSNKIKFAKHLWDKNGRDILVKIGKPSELKNLFFIVRTNKDTITKMEKSLKEVVDKLVTNNRLEDFISLGGMDINSGPFLKYALAYAYIFPDGGLVRQQEELKNVLRNILKNVPMYEIAIPYNYNSTVFNEVNRFIETLD
jgi:hypothetical protein